MVVTTLVLALMGCSTAPSAVDGPNRMQRTRAAFGADGSFVSSHLLLRDDDGAPLSCSDGTLTVEMAYSTEGETGPWQTLDQDLVVRCPDASGDLAVVLDNSGSTAGAVATLRGASSLLVDEVIDAGGRASLVRVSTNARVLHDLTDDSSSLVSTISGDLNDDSNGWTALWDGVRMGNETFGGAVVHRDSQVGFEDLDAFCSQSDRLGIVAFTDGHENNSADQQDYDHQRYPGDGFDTTVADLMALSVGGQSTPIYTVGLGGEPDHDALEMLADSTGGAHSRIDDVSEIGPLFERLGDYFESTHQVCGQLPEPVCGTSHIQLSWTLRDANGSVLNSGETVQAFTGTCPVEPPQGRQATVLLTMTNPHLPADEVERFANNTVGWVSPVADPRVLVVLDDSHHDEFDEDADAVDAMLRAAGVDSTRLDEPEDGLTRGDLDGYDVVWFSNPGYPPDDLASIQALASFNADGGGLVLQGDDMTWSAGNAFSMAELTGLEHLENGVNTCDVLTDDNQGERFEVQTEAGFEDHPLFAGLSDISWLYGDDIDLSVPRGAGEQVLASAGLELDPTCALRPAIAVFDPDE